LTDSFLAVDLPRVCIAVLEVSTCLEQIGQVIAVDSFLVGTQNTRSAILSPGCHSISITQKTRLSILTRGVGSCKVNPRANRRSTGRIEIMAGIFHKPYNRREETGRIRTIRGDPIGSRRHANGKRVFRGGLPRRLANIALIQPGCVLQRSFLLRC